MFMLLIPHIRWDTPETPRNVHAAHTTYSYYIFILDIRTTYSYYIFVLHIRTTYSLRRHYNADSISTLEVLVLNFNVLVLEFQHLFVALQSQHYEAGLVSGAVLGIFSLFYWWAFYALRGSPKSPIYWNSWIRFDQFIILNLSNSVSNEKSL